MGLRRKEPQRSSATSKRVGLGYLDDHNTQPLWVSYLHLPQPPRGCGLNTLSSFAPLKKGCHLFMKRIFMLTTLALMLAAAMALSGVAQAAGSPSAKCQQEAASLGLNLVGYKFIGG